MKKILVVAAHPDDEIIGVGATISRRVAEGDEAYALILGEGQTSRYDKREMASQNIVDDLHSDTIMACKKVGYSKVFFENLPDNRFDSVALLDVVKPIEKLIKDLEPDVIYTHFAGDLNIDHQISNRAVITATRPTVKCTVKEVYSFETLSATEWNFIENDSQFKPNVFIDVEDFFDNKLEAMKKYKSELCDFPHPRSIEAMNALAEYRGAMSGLKKAESFYLIRVVE